MMIDILLKFQGCVTAYLMIDYNHHYFYMRTPQKLAETSFRISQGFLKAQKTPSCCLQALYPRSGLQLVYT